MTSTGVPTVLRIAAAIALSCGALAGCGSEGDSAGADAAPPTGPAYTSPEQAKAESKAALKRIEEAKRIQEEGLTGTERKERGKLPRPSSKDSAAVKAVTVKSTCGDYLALSAGDRLAAANRLSRAVPTNQAGYRGWRETITRICEREGDDAELISFLKVFKDSSKEPT